MTTSEIGSAVSKTDGNEKKQWKRDVSKIYVQTIKERNGLKILSYRRYGDSGENIVVVFFNIVRLRHAADVVRSR